MPVRRMLTTGMMIGDACSVHVDAAFTMSATSCRSVKLCAYDDDDDDDDVAVLSKSPSEAEIAAPPSHCVCSVLLFVAVSCSAATNARRLDFAF